MRCRSELMQLSQLFLAFTALILGPYVGQTELERAPGADIILGYVALPPDDVKGTAREPVMARRYPPMDPIGLGLEYFQKVGETGGAMAVPFRADLVDAPAGKMLATILIPFVVTPGE